MEKSRQIIPKRGEVYLVAFDPAVGAEIKKTRPALVLQNDIGNRYASTTIVAAITSRKDDELYPMNVLVRKPEGGLEADSTILLDQVRTIDKSRLWKKLGKCKPETMHRVDDALAISVGLVK